MTRAQRTLQLGAYADGEIDPAGRAAVEAFLASNPEAAADVEDRRRLRRLVQRVNQETLVPETLRAEVTRLIARERNARRTRGLRLFAASSFAAAALIMLAMTVGGPGILDKHFIAPPPVAALPVATNSFLQRWATCSGPSAHDELAVAGKASADVSAAIQKLKLFPREELNVPDLKSFGYELAGACQSNVVPGAQTLQLTFRHVETGRRLAMFISSRPIALQIGSAPVAELDLGGRMYAYADLRDGMSVVKWNERFCSIVLCGEAHSGELAQIAQKITVFERTFAMGHPFVVVATAEV
jgi:anti-sigma factor RsiW